MSHVRRPFRRNPSGNERERTGSLAFCPPLYDSIHTHTIAEFSITLFSGGLTQNESSLKKKDQMLSLLASGRVATRGFGKQLLRDASAKPGGAGGRTKLVILGTGWGGFRLGKSLAQAGCNAHRGQLSRGCTGLLHLFVVGSAHVRLLCVSPFDVCVCVPGAAPLEVEQDTPIERWSLSMYGTSLGTSHPTSIVRSIAESASLANSHVPSRSSRPKPLSFRRDEDSHTHVRRE